MLGYSYRCTYSINNSNEWFKIFLDDVLDPRYCPNAEELYYVGVCYDNGYGVEENTEEAVKWFLKSAEVGFVVLKWISAAAIFMVEV